MCRYEIRSKSFNDYIIYDNILRDYIRKCNKIIHFTASSAKQWMIDNHINEYLWR